MSIGVRSRPVADAFGAPVLRDQGPIGRPGTARPMQGFGTNRILEQAVYDPKVAYRRIRCSLIGGLLNEVEMHRLGTC